MSAESPSTPKPAGKPLFSLGRVMATPGAIELLSLTETDARLLLLRHVSGNWGEIHPDDVAVNADSLAHGGRLMSVYRLPLRGTAGTTDTAPPVGDLTDDRLWIITEADRSVTTLLLPEEY